MNLYQKIKSFLGLSLALAKAGFRLESEGTWLGVLWYLLAPMLTFILMLSIFYDRLGQDIPSYPLYLLLGIILFNYFRKITVRSVAKIKNEAELIKSLNFQREAMIGEVTLQTLFAHIFEFLILIAFLLIFKISPVFLIYYPLILLLVTLFSFGSALILSSLFVYFFDLKEIWSFVSQLIWFGTPIFYQIGGQTTLFKVNLFNPMYYFITLAREIIVYNKTPDTWLIIGSLGYAFLFLTLGLLIFSKLKKKFAEMI